ncbi:RHS repeat-associated core domain-containing protein [Rothia sp. LK2492]|uniref:RHS repeat-associated core domain-containing protein n=1 Tax=Rothia sp. LK2492 TaxID=3114370 RepID=UPI0034CEDB13
MSVAASSSSVAPGFGVTVAGSLQVAGLEILGVRAYDPISRGFISPDPLVSPVGAGWASNVYAFVGNDPVGLVDPWGLSPMTASEFREYRADTRGRAVSGLSLA